MCSVLTGVCANVFYAGEEETTMEEEETLQLGPEK